MTLSAFGASVRRMDAGQPPVAANGVSTISPQLWAALEEMVRAEIKSAFASALADPDVNPIAKSIAGHQTAKRKKS